MEVWKPVKGYEDKYAVSNLGRIKSIRFNRLLKVYPAHVEGNFKLYRVCFNVNSQQHWYSLARVIYEAFNDKMLETTRMEYIDGNPKNCVLSNITPNTLSAVPIDELAKLCEVMTTGELAEYYGVRESSMFKKLAQYELKSIPATIWNEENIQRLADLSKTHTQVELAEIFGVTQTRISEVLQYHSIKEVDHRLKHRDSVIDWSQEVDNLISLSKTHNQAEIAEIYNTSASNVWQALRRYDIQKDID